MSQTSNVIVLFVLIVIVIIVVYLALFRVTPAPPTPVPQGAGSKCNYNTDCGSGMYCSSLTDANGNVQTGVCSPYCVSSTHNWLAPKGAPPGAGVDSCTMFVTPSATCQSNNNGISYMCALTACSAQNAQTACSSGEICVASTTGGTSGFCYPNPTGTPYYEPTSIGQTTNTSGSNLLPSRTICDPSSNGGLCYGNPNIPCVAGTIPGTSQQGYFCQAKAVLQPASL